MPTAYMTSFLGLGLTVLVLRKVMKAVVGLELLAAGKDHRPVSTGLGSYCHHRTAHIINVIRIMLITFIKECN